MAVKLVFRGDVIRARRVRENDHKVSLKTGMTYVTMRRYLNNPESAKDVSLKALGGLLVYGLGLSKEEAADLRFGDIFEFVDCD